jgi:hypothetical protein
MLKSNPQYLSNIAMKFNAKLGGATARIAGVRAFSFLFF